MQDTVENVLNDPLSQKLLASGIPARLAYNAPDGSPRAVPIGFHWDGAAFQMFTHPGTPKVRALQADPRAALTIDTNEFPPDLLLVRGTVTVGVEEGVPEEYLIASRKTVPPEMWDGFEQQVAQTYERMARITLTPTWAKVMDFETRAPEVFGR